MGSCRPTVDSRWCVLLGLVKEAGGLRSVSEASALLFDALLKSGAADIIKAALTAAGLPAPKAEKAVGYIIEMLRGGGQ